ncbi:MAG TPA: toll/interleukin-1 receptor domain-containing protein [Allosphingosinicella sp.]|nr:toll/interleukin-1 receptor domain-containing protein [Allosphingosinicella sp.]
MADVFISYAKTDGAAVRRLAEAVRQQGYSVWWDEELPPHLSYSDVIAEQIGAAKAAIVVWSESAARSQWVRAEADLARNQAKLIQASVDGRMPPMPFNQIQFAAIGDWGGEEDHQGWLKIKASLAVLAGPRQAAAAPPPPIEAPAAPHKWHRVLIAMIAAAFLFIAAAGLYAWLRGRAPAPAPPPQAARPPETPAPAPPAEQRRAEPAPRPRAATRPPRQDVKPEGAQVSPRLAEIRRARLRARDGRRR